MNAEYRLPEREKNLMIILANQQDLVEYTYFARSFDSRIQTQCVGCPPDGHPENWICSWRFYIKE
jgi:hypothetical protein